jgi:DNA end-binding protein Ku
MRATRREPQRGHFKRSESIEIGNAPPRVPIRVSKGSYLMIEDHELDAIEIESNHRIEIDSFVPRAEIDERFLDMRGKDMVALGRVVLSKRERVIMLELWDKGLLAMTLRYPYEFARREGLFLRHPDVKVEPDLLSLAQHVLKTKEARFDPTKFVDRYEQAVVEVLDKKKAGLPPETVKAFAPPRAVPDPMEAFRKSLAAVESEAANDEGKSVKASRPRKPKPKVEGQLEMLLPIAGGKGEAKAKPAKVSTPRRKAG